VFRLRRVDQLTLAPLQVQRHERFNTLVHCLALSHVDTRNTHCR
jgi:hypothetical protein